MGFYGKIEHTDKLNFVIDKIYPNRKTMEEEIDKDGIFIGRYVLIEYEQANVNPYIRLYKNPASMDFYFDSNFNIETKAKYIENKNEEINNYYIELNEIIYIIKEDGTKQFYKCTGKIENSIYAAFTEIYNPENSGTYHVNYNIDIEEYGESRGYDSTVWQKIYIDEKEKYVMIAELNSVVPTFDITVDAPTLNPIPPHFDADSNNVYYKLHMQPNWGFKVKEAQNSNLSDANIQATLVEWDEVNKTINKKNKNYKGAIYFNRDGFDSTYHYNKNDNNIPLENNYIQLTEESSGRLYNINHGYNNQNDIQALEIMLPGIGRALSELWDLAYGTGEAEEEDNDRKERNKEVNWDTITGLRLVKTSRDPDNSGFEYDIKNIDTIAGCINSVHDLIGMIIVNDKNQELEIDKALVNRIYYRDGQYWIKNLTYKYIDITNENQKIENMNQFGDNYYYKNNNNYYKELEGYQAGNQYYKFGENVVSGVKLCQEAWKPGVYYYKEGENYKLDNSDFPDETKQYFKIKNNSSLENIVDNKKTGLCFFPKNYSPEIYNKLFPTVKGTEEFKGKGLFYIGEDADGKSGYLPYEQGKNIGFQSPLSYWDGYKMEISTTASGKFIETYEFGEATLTPIKMVEFEEGKYYYQNSQTKEWILLNGEDEIDLNQKYYYFDKNGLEIISIDGYFYEPNLYYYLDYVDYILDTSLKRKPDAAYYTIDESKVLEISKDIVFYEPNKYFYYNGEEYVVDTNETMTEGREYYKNIYDYYVNPKSTNNAFAPGEKWNKEITDIPEGIILSNREEKYEWKQLKGFSRSLNTINGLILKINNILKFDDELTRDTQTVQGCINQMNDIINTIDKLKPNNLIAVDEYGRMTSMAQESDKWIDIQINKNNNDKIIITHTGPIASNEPKKDDLEPKFGDKFELEVYHFDDRGHNSNITTHSIKIPQGDLIDSSITDSNIITKLAFDKPTGVLSTTRENISNIKLADYEKNSNNNDIVNTDTLGQALSKLQTQITEEENARSNIINSLNMNSESNTHFISKITQTNGQVAIERAAAGTLQIADANGSYIIPDNASAISKTDSIAVAFGKVEAQIKTENTNRNKAINTLTNNLNKEIQNRTDAINALDATLSTETTAEVITSITQTNGKLTSIGKTAIGNLTLNGWTLGQSVANDESIADTDTVNSAFAKTQRQINANKVTLTVLNGNSTTQGSVAYQIAEAIKTENLGQYALNSSLENLENRVEVIEEKDESWDNGLERITALEGLIDADKVAVWDKAEENVQADWAEEAETADSFIKNKPDLSDVVRTADLDDVIKTTTTFDYVYNETTTEMTILQLLEKIADLEARIAVLENPVSPGTELTE